MRYYFFLKTVLTFYTEIGCFNSIILNLVKHSFIFTENGSASPSCVMFIIQCCSRPSASWASLVDDKQTRNPSCFFCPGGSFQGFLLFVLYYSVTMSKNTLSSAFRKIDVDAFNEDNFKDEESASNSSSSSSADAGQVQQLLQGGKHAEALKMALANAPVGNKNQQEKVGGKPQE